MRTLLTLLLVMAGLTAAAQDTRYYLYGGGVYAPAEPVVLGTWLDGRPATDLILYRVANPGDIMSSGGPDQFDITRDLELHEHLSREVIEISSGRNTEIDLGQLPIGVYVAQLGPADTGSAVVVVVTDLALVTKRDADTLLLYTSSLTTGEPLAAELSVLTGDGLTALNTDADGLATFPADEPGTLPVGAHNGDSWAFSNAWWSSWNGDVPSTYLVTDRPVYQPGQQVELKGTTRLARSVAPVSGALVTVTIDNADYEEIFSAEVTTDAFGSFTVSVPLPESAPLGYYSIRAEVHGSSSWGSFWVEEYVLPEFEVQVEAAEEYSIHGQSTTFTVSAGYLFGGPVAGGTVSYVVLSEPYSRWAWRSPYGFYDTASSTYGGSVIARGEAVIGPDGTVALPVTLQPQDSDYRLTLEASVTDESGRAVTAQASMIAYRADLVLGLSSGRYSHPVDEPLSLTVTAQDLEGNPLSTGFTVSTERSYWVDGAGVQFEAGPTYAGETAADGETTIMIDPGVAGSWRVTVTATDAEGRLTDSDMFMWLFGGEAVYWDHQYLEVQADKEEYVPGETARFVIESPVADGWALLTREGDQVSGWELVRFAGNTFTYELEVDGSEVPNSYLGVVVVGDGEIYSTSTSFRVDPTQRFLNVQIEADSAVFEPGTSTALNVLVTDAHGQPVQAQLTIAVVDEAVFMIRPERTPDVRGFFYGWRSNGVSTELSTWMYFGQVEPVSEARAAMDEAVFAQAKSDSAAASPEPEEPRLREDFRETILWSTETVTGTDGRATVQLDFSDNLTRWRVTARAISERGLVGQEQLHLTTTLPVLARVALPSYLVRGDEARVRVIGQSNLADTLQARWSLRTEGLELIDDSGAPRAAELPAGGRAVQDWRVHADNVGTTQVEASVTTTEASDALRLPVPVDPRGVREELVWAGQGDATWEFELPDTMTTGTLRGSVSLVPDLTAAVAPAVDWLTRQEYGYTEAALSRLLTFVLAQQSGVELPDGLPPADEFIAVEVNRLLQLQHPDGGFGYWRFGVSSPVISAYVATGLLTVREAGYAVNEWQLTRTLDYLEHAVSLESFEVYRYMRDEAARAAAVADARAWAWFALARAGRHVPQLEGLPGDPALSNHGLVLSILALSHSGNETEAQLYLDELLSRIVDRDAVAYWNPEAPRYIWSDDRVSTTALALQALAELRPDAEVIPRIVNWLLLERSGSHWYSSRDTAAVVQAALLLEGAAGDSGEMPVPVTVRLNNVIVAEFELGSDQVEADLSGLPARGRNVLSISVPAEARVYSSAALSFMVEEAFTEPVDAGMNVSRTYSLLTPVWNEEAQHFIYGHEEADSFTAGDFVLVTLTVEPQGELRFVSVLEPLPAGFTVVEEDRSFRLAGIPRRYGEDYWGWNYWFDSRELSERSIDFYFTELTEPVTFTYVLRAEHPGRFTALPAQARLLYERDITGRTAADLLEVVPAGE